MADVFSLQGSLPDQLPIIEISSIYTSEEPLKAIPPKITEKKRKSKKLEAILKPHYVKSRYFTCIGKVTEEDLKKKESPFKYPKDIEEFAHNVMNKAWRDDIRIKELQKKVINRPSYRDRQKEDLLKRLYVAEPRLVGGKSVYNIDPNYYSVVQGRPIQDKLNIREYIDTLRESLRTKIVTGYRQDDMMLIDETMTLEQKMIDIIRENLKNYINAFEEFLIIDHRSAMKLLQEADAASKSAYNKYTEHKLVVKSYVSLRSSLYNVESKWKLCKTYQKFLYNVSPLTWRMQQEPRQRRTSIYMMEQNPEDMLGMFGNYRLSVAEKGVSLEDIVSEFREEMWHDNRPPQLYFTHPEELLDVFRFIEMQNLDSLLHSEELALPLEHIMDNMSNAEKIFDRDIRLLQEIIYTLETGISWEEQRVSYLEHFAVGLIKNELTNLVNHERVLNLHVFVEDIYESTAGSNDANYTIWEMMKSIEEKYRYELLSMDKVPSQEIAKLEGNYYQEEMLVMKLAERAAKQHHELEKITVGLKKAYSPPPKRNKRELKNRTPPIKQPLKVPEPPRSLTDGEKEFLEYFTTFCEYKDDPRDFGINAAPEALACLETKKISKVVKIVDIEDVHI